MKYPAQPASENLDRLDGTVEAQRLTLNIGNVDNTSDANKPISTATQTALDGKQNSDAGLTSLAALASTGFVYVVSGNTFSTRTNVVTTFNDSVVDGLNQFTVGWGGSVGNAAYLTFSSESIDNSWARAFFNVSAEEGVSFEHGQASVELLEGAGLSRLRYNTTSFEVQNGEYYVTHPEEFRNAIGLGSGNTPIFYRVKLTDAGQGEHATLIIEDNRLIVEDYQEIPYYFVFRNGDTFTGQVSFSGSTHAGLRANNLSNAQIVALVNPLNGCFVYDTDIHRFQGRCNSAWRSIVDTSGGQTIAGTTTFGSGSGSIVVRQSTNFGIIENSTASGGVIIKSSGTSAGCYYDGSFHNFRNGAGSANIWTIASTGHLQPGTTNTSDIGTTSVRPRDAWLSRNLDVAGTTFLGRFIFSALPSASANTDGLVVCTDRTNRPLAKSDGTNWRNVFDGTILT